MQSRRWSPRRLATLTWRPASPRSRCEHAAGAHAHAAGRRTAVWRGCACKGRSPFFFCLPPPCCPWLDDDGKVLPSVQGALPVPC